MAKKTCMVCGAEIGVMSRKLQLKDGVVCKKCFKKMGVTLDDMKMIPAQMTLEELQQYLSQRDEETVYIENFKPTDNIGDIGKFNDDEEVALLSNSAYINSKAKHYTKFSYSQIVDYEILENGLSIAKGGIGRAAVGGILFGGAGAIVGASTRKQKEVCDSLQVKVTVKGYKDPAFFIKLISTGTKKDGIIYRSNMEIAQKLASKFELIIEENKSKVHQQQENLGSATVDAADEIRKFKGLLDDGIITQEEFDAKKKQLLGL